MQSSIHTIRETEVVGYEFIAIEHKKVGERLKLFLGGGGGALSSQWYSFSTNVTIPT